MKALPQIILICCAVSATAQSLPLPPRATNAPGGVAFARQLEPLDFAAREAAISAAVLAGNVPDFLRHFCPVSVTNTVDGVTNVATFFAAPDYLAVGANDDYCFTPVSPATAQQLADALDCVLPTRKMSDAIYAAAEVKLAPSPISPTPAMTTVPVFEHINELIHTQRVAQLAAHPLGTLVAGDKKDVVISARLATSPRKVAIYGWHQTNGVAIQPLFLGHTAAWVDYSHGIRLVSQTIIVNGQTNTIPQVWADPKLCGLLSDEGVIANGRYATNAIAPAPVDVLDLPWPKGFSPGSYPGERIREIHLPDEIRLLINAPAEELMSSNRPVELIFYALPNGNTIEQTIGKTLPPGDDWHFDIQHIGAQTRFLRQVITNRNLVVVYLEAGLKSWPAWRKKYDDHRLAQIVTRVRGIIPATNTEVVLAGHSGGGSLIFGYLNAVETIPDWIKRIAFLDSDYAYDTSHHAEKLRHWLASSPENHLCVLAYQDYLARLNGKPFVSEAGGTWGRSHVLLNDLGSQFTFTSRTNNGLEQFSTSNAQIEFLLKENPEGKILHTVQVERNGFIQSLLSGTADEEKGYEYLGPRAYSALIEGK